MAGRRVSWTGLVLLDPRAPRQVPEPDAQRRRPASTVLLRGTVAGGIFPAIRKAVKAPRGKEEPAETVTARDADAGVHPHHQIVRSGETRLTATIT